MPYLRKISLPWYSWIFTSGSSLFRRGPRYAAGRSETIRMEKLRGASRSQGRLPGRSAGATAAKMSRKHPILSGAAIRPQPAARRDRMPYALALDQGTTSSRAILFDQGGAVRAVAQQEFRQIFPQPGWVEHDAEEIWATQSASCDRGARRGRHRGRGHRGHRHHQPARDDARLGPADGRSRSTTPSSGRTGAPRRMCDELAPRAGAASWSARRPASCSTPTSPAPSSRWLLDNVPGARARAERGELAFGTDRHAGCIWQLTGGRVHATDVTNASRTLLFNLHTRRLGRRAARAASACRARCCPEVRARQRASRRRTAACSALPTASRSRASPAISRRRCSARRCFDAGPGEEHLRHRLLPADEHRRRSRSRRSNGLLTTVAWQIGAATPDYALEGSVFIAGAVGAVAARRARAHPQGRRTSRRWRARVPDTGGVYLRARVRRPRRAALGSATRAARSSASRAAPPRRTSRARRSRAIALQSADLLERDGRRTPGRR